VPRLFQLAFIAVHRTVYRLSRGRLMSKMNGMQILLLTTRGRRSGKRRTLPVAYIREGDAYALCASAAGAPHHPGWFHNASTAGEAQIQVGSERCAVQVENAEPATRDLLYARFKETSGVFAGYEQKTERTFPVLILRPEHSVEDDHKLGD
jgi:deazaflavin-dependent oxidoreductase (nitroreductase family)